MERVERDADGQRELDHGQVGADDGGDVVQLAGGEPGVLPDHQHAQVERDRADEDQPAVARGARLQPPPGQVVGHHAGEQQQRRAARAGDVEQQARHGDHAVAPVPGRDEDGREHDRKEEPQEERAGEGHRRRPYPPVTAPWPGSPTNRPTSHHPRVERSGPACRTLRPRVSNVQVACVERRSDVRGARVLRSGCESSTLSGRGPKRSKESSPDGQISRMTGCAGSGAVPLWSGFVSSRRPPQGQPHASRGRQQCSGGQR